MLCLGRRNDLSHIQSVLPQPRRNLREVKWSGEFGHLCDIIDI